MDHFYRRKAFLLSIAFLLSFFFILSFYLILIRPPAETSSIKVIYIKKGTNLRKISEILKQEGIIRNANFFIATATLLGKRGEIKAGEYEFQPQMFPWKVLDTLIRGQVKRQLITIPEGYTLSQIAQLLEDLNIVEKQDFLKKASSANFISSLNLPYSVGPTLEGTLFPDTYHLFKGMDPEEVIQMMIHQFKKVFSSDLTHRSLPLGISEKEVIILASIIEKEASLSEEKPLISAVFHNRLKKKVPLQSDPTVIYGIKNFNGNLTKDHLMKYTPYNTYLVAGLPPAPICNPGKGSILAALHPAPVPYFYFVSKNDGSHYFSSDIEEHNRAVWKFQKNKGKK